MLSLLLQIIQRLPVGPTLTLPETQKTTSGQVLTSLLPYFSLLLLTSPYFSLLLLNSPYFSLLLLTSLLLDVQSHKVACSSEDTGRHLRLA